MPQYTDSLRGYALPTHRRDRWTCVYCGLDGRQSFSSWLCLSEEHLLPKGHRSRNDPQFIVTACFFCNVSDNQYFAKALERGIDFDDKTPEELIALRRPYVLETRASYRTFWERHVRAQDEMGR